MKVSVGKRVLALMLVIPMVLSTACGTKSEKSKDKELEKKTVDISECVSVSARGYDGMGAVSCQKDSAAINKLLQDVMTEQYGEEVESETKKAYTKLEESIIFQAEPATGLSNGDEVTIKIVYDSKYAKTCGVKFSPSSFKYTVNGLDTVQMIDAFDGLEVTFSGTETATGVIVDNTRCSDFVRNFVVFHVEDKKEAYKNGEALVVNAEFGENLPAEYDGLYMLSEKTHSYTVDGLDMYPTTIDNLDVSEVVKATHEKGTGFVSNKLYNDLDDYPRINGTKYNTFSDSFVSISNLCIKPEKIYFACPKSNSDGLSTIVILYHMTYHASGYNFSDISLAAEEEVDTYFAVASNEFTSDSTQSVLKSVGTSFMVGESDDEEYLCNNHTYEQGYNAFIAPYAEGYVINELNPADYAAVLT